MRFDGDFRLALRSTTMLLGAVLIVAPTRAQGADPAARMNAIEAQIRALQSELRSVRSDLAQRDRQLRAVQRDAAQARVEAPSATQRPRGQAAAAPAPAAGAPDLSAPNLNAQASAPGGAGGAGQQQDSSQQNASTTPTPTPMGTFRLGGITVTLGGFIEGAAVVRSRNEVADIASNFNTGIPLPNSPLYHQREFRGTARQSRVSLLVTGNIDPAQKLSAYFETDFQGAAPTANSNESNSYNLRLRQAYATYDNTALGLHGLAGQAWSLLTPYKVGITPRSEDLPLSIDAQYAVGFTWTRQPQLRVVGDFADHRLWAGLSFESPQAVYGIGPNGSGVLAGSTLTTSSPGGSGFASTTNYSADVAPDVIGKLAWDPGFGHYEAVGLLRFLQTRVSSVGNGNNKVSLAGGGGVTAIIPIIKDKLEFHGNVLAGVGLGRYGSAQLPDATVSQSGAPSPLPEIAALGGLVSHPVPNVDLYAYVGTEQVGRRSFTSGGKGYGYGSPLYINTGCYVELSASPCQANTSGVVEGSLGAWWRFLHGPYGTAQVGGQYEYLRRSVFGAVGGSRSTDDNVFLLSFRYLPFQ